MATFDVTYIGYREEITQHQTELRQHKASSQQRMQQLVQLHFDFNNPLIA